MSVKIDPPVLITNDVDSSGHLLETPKRLIPLTEHNKQRSAQHKQDTPNGIACPNPQCRKELVDSGFANPRGTNPESLFVHCPKCGYHGIRLL